MTEPNGWRSSLAFQAELASIATALKADVGRAFRRLDPRRLAATVPDLRDDVVALVEEYGSAAAGAALDHFETERRLWVPDGGRPYLPRPADLVSTDVIADAVGWSVADLWDLDDEALNAAEAAFDAAPAVDAATETAPALPDTPEDPGSDGTDETSGRLGVAETKLVGVATVRALDRGRNTVILNAYEDPSAYGWLREPEAEACAFCLILATRGAVFTEHAFDVSDSKFTGNGRAKVHDHCACAFSPVFRRNYKLAPDIAEWKRIQKPDRNAKAGLTLNEFRTEVRTRRKNGTAPVRPTLEEVA